MSSSVYLIVFWLVLFGSTVQAADSDVCWRNVGLEDGISVKLFSDNDIEFEAIFSTNVDVEVQLPGNTHTPSIIAEDTTVRLVSGTGQLELKNGPILLSPLNSQGQYIVQDSSTALEGLKLSPAQGVSIKLPTAIAEGKYPANTEARVVLDNGSVNARLITPVSLPPKEPTEFLAWLDPGELPITRGGRTLKVELYAPNFSSEQLASEVFQSCFYDDSPDYFGASVAPVKATMANIESVRDGHVTLIVPVPDELNLRALYNKVHLQVLGPTLGILSSDEDIYIGNPMLAFVLSIIIILCILFNISSRVINKRHSDAFLARLFVFTIGVDGNNSLSLFQIYIWTTLVLVGMIYVFFMTGDLLNVSQQVLILVGLTGAGSIGARWISISSGGSSPAKGSGFWGMFVVCGKPDMLRLQLFLFTLTIWIYVAVRIFYEQAFPELDPNVLLLMGISNGVYVGAKWAVAGDPAASLRLQENEMRNKIYALEVQAENLKDPQALDDLKKSIEASTNELEMIVAKINQL